MKFICTKENLLSTLSLVNGITSKNINLPILSNILIKVSNSKVEVISTNLEIAIKTSLRAKIEAEGEFTVPAKTFFDIVQLFPKEQITVEKQENELVVACGSSKTKLKGMPVDDYPVIPEIEEKHNYVVPVGLFQNGLVKTVIAASKNEIRPELSGVYFGFFTEYYKGLILAATDSYRLAEKRVPVEQGADEVRCIVPSRTVLELIRLLTVAKKQEEETQVRLWVSDNQILVRYGQFEFSSRLVQGNYPDYAQIIPQVFKTSAKLDIEEFSNKIKAASLFSVAGVNAVSFDFAPENKTITISSASSETGEYKSDIIGEMEGEKNSTLLNFRYVIEGLQQAEGIHVTFCVNSNDTPCILKQEEHEYIYVIMPIRQ